MSNNATSILNADSPAVAAHLTILQSIIARMASNSSASKAWCITIVSAIIVLISDKGKPEFALLSMIPTIIFLFLDWYYLTMELKFRDAYDTFVNRLHKGEITSNELFHMSPKGGVSACFWAARKSVSLLPFYVFLILTIVGCYYLVDHHPVDQKKSEAIASPNPAILPIVTTITTTTAKGTTTTTYNGPAAQTSGIPQNTATSAEQGPIETAPVPHISQDDQKGPHKSQESSAPEEKKKIGHAISVTPAEQKAATVPIAPPSASPPIPGDH